MRYIQICDARIRNADLAQVCKKVYECTHSLAYFVALNVVVFYQQACFVDRSALLTVTGAFTCVSCGEDNCLCLYKNNQQRSRVLELCQENAIGPYEG